MTLQEAKNRFKSHSFGVFTHFLYSAAGAFVPEEADVTDWNARVELYDCERVARDLHEIGADYYVLTLMQGNPYMAAPNATFDRIVGCEPGEFCARRDLVLDLAKALEKYDIDLFLYFTGDGPYKDEEIGKKFGFINPRRNVPREFVEKWAAVLEEYAVRYGELVKGWWLDGTYAWFGYDQELMRIYENAVRKGNPSALVTMNDGVRETVYRWYEREDYTSGEFNDFTHIPENIDIGDSVAHILAPLGNASEGVEMGPGGGWCHGGLQRDGAYMHDYVRKVNAAGGVVTVDIEIRYDSTFDPLQLDCLKQIKGE